MNIKLYRLTDKAREQFRNGAKKGKDLDDESLDRKMSSLVYASRDKFYFSDDDFTAAFGSCMITVAEDRITDIRWTKDVHACGIDRREKEAMLEAYEYFDLDKNGDPVKAKVEVNI